MPQDDDPLARAIAGALRAAIHAHGPITLEHIGSATKRILGSLRNARGGLGRLLGVRRWGDAGGGEGAGGGGSTAPKGGGGGGRGSERMEESHEHAVLPAQPRRARPGALPFDHRP